MPKIQLRRDTAVGWTSANPVLASGEAGFESDTGQVKVGNGSTAWTALAYLTSSGGSGTGISRSILTLTSSATLGAVANTDYTAFVNFPSADASFSSVTALLHGDGANASTTITDSSFSANWTASGNAKLSTGTKKFGTASISFDGSATSYISPSSTTGFTFGTGDFTIEFFFYANGVSGPQILFDARASATNGLYPTIYLSGTNLRYLTNGSDRIAISGIAASTWYHVAVSRVSGVTNMYLNGTAGSSYTDSNNYICAAGRPYIGTNSFAADSPLNGFIDEIRITKGVSRYTANFTAPTAAFDDGTAGTVTLPTAVLNKNLYTIKNVSAAATTLATTSSQTINGAVPAALAVNAQIQLFSDGNNWRTISTGTAALGSGVTRTISTITTPTTLGSDPTTEYVTYIGSGGSVTLPTAVGNTSSYILKNIDTVSKTIATVGDDPQWASVTSLLQGDGANNATTITDSALIPATWAVSGNAKLSTSAKKFGTASISFDGTNSYIYPSSGFGNPFSGDFTIEMWVYINSITGNQLLVDCRSGGEGANISLYLDTSRVLYFYQSSANRITGTALTVATWTHIALCRSGTSTRMFVNGTQVGSTYTDTTAYLVPAFRPVIGGNGGNVTPAWFNGYMDDVRITSAARYTANFTAPTAELPLPQLVDGYPLVLAPNQAVELASKGTGWSVVSDAGASDTVVTLSTAQSLANKTLNSPTLTTPVINGIPTGTGVATTEAANTLVLRDSKGVIAGTFHPFLLIG
jgi:hypothetical protein